MGILPQLAGKLDGMALNVPVPDGSNVDLVALAKRPVTKDEINEAVKAAAKGPFRDILEYTEQPIVSSDVIGNDHSAVFDALSTSVLGGNLVKTITWYDNGWGYARRCVELIERMTEQKEEFDKTPVARIPSAVFDFFKLWITTHIMIVDKKYGEYCVANGIVDPHAKTG